MFNSFSRKSLSTKIISAFIAFTFIFTTVIPPQARAQVGITLPAPQTMVMPTNAYTPILVNGLTVHPENPLQFDFIVSKGDSGIQNDEIAVESKKLIKYFLAGLTVPEKEMWVNLSPYEKNRIISEKFGATEMGRDLLAQDYLLKQLTASMMYPEDETGKAFWERVYSKAMEKFGTTDIPMNTFNKIWIVPESAKIYENGNSAFVLDSKLKVMLEEDYVAMSHQKDMAESRDPSRDVALQKAVEGGDTSVTSSVTSDVVREVLIPEIEKEVNEGKVFANLRQIYNSIILAVWYKNTLQDSLLSQVYVNKSKTKGVNVDDPKVNQEIYNQYLEAFKKGVYNYIREDYDPVNQEVIPRRYFSGGISNFTGLRAKTEILTPDTIKGPDQAMAAKKMADTFKVGANILEYSGNNVVQTEKVEKKTTDTAMISAEFMSEYKKFSAKLNELLKKKKVSSNSLQRVSIVGRLFGFVEDIKELDAPGKEPKYKSQEFADIFDKLYDLVAKSINKKVRLDIGLLEEMFKKTDSYSIKNVLGSYIAFEEQVSTQKKEKLINFDFLKKFIGKISKGDEVRTFSAFEKLLKSEAIQNKEDLDMFLLMVEKDRLSELKPTDKALLADGSIQRSVGDIIYHEGDLVEVAGKITLSDDAKDAQEEILELIEENEEKIKEADKEKAKGENEDAEVEEDKKETPDAAMMSNMDIIKRLMLPEIKEVIGVDAKKGKELAEKGNKAAILAFEHGKEYYWEGAQNRMGWTAKTIENILKEPQGQKALAQVIKDGKEIRENFDNVVFCGMGGSGLSVELVKSTFNGDIDVYSLRTTDPTAIKDIIEKVAGGYNPAEKLKKLKIVVISKSGTTAETVSHLEYFSKIYKDFGVDPSINKNIIVYTDPGSPMDWESPKGKEAAKKKNPKLLELMEKLQPQVRTIQLDGGTDVGGRNTSPTTNVFLLPLAILQQENVVLDVLQRALESSKVPGNKSQYFKLGAYLYEMAKKYGKDKVTFIVPDEIKALPMWAEQLFEESLGKFYKGVTIFSGEDLNEDMLKSVENNDRVFVRFNLSGKFSVSAKEKKQNDFVNSIKEKGYPVFDINEAGTHDIGAILLGLQMAVTSIGYLWNITTLDQDDVEGYKSRTRGVMGALKPGEIVKIPEEWVNTAIKDGIMTFHYQPIIEAGKRMQELIKKFESSDREIIKAMPMQIAEFIDKGFMDEEDYIKEFKENIIPQMKKNIITEQEIIDEVTRLGTDMQNAPAIYAAVFNISTRKGGLGAADTFSYGRMSKDFRELLQRARSIYTKKYKIPTKLAEGPDINHAYIQNTTGGTDFRISTFIMSEETKQPTLVMNGSNTEFPYDENLLISPVVGTIQSLIGVGRRTVLITLEKAIDDLDKSDRSNIDKFFEDAAKYMKAEKARFYVDGIDEYTGIKEINAGIKRNEEQIKSMLEKGVKGYLASEVKKGKFVQKDADKFLEETLKSFKEWLTSKAIDKYTKLGLLEAFADQRWEDITKAHSGAIKFGTAGLREKAALTMEELHRLNKDGFRAIILKGPGTINNITLAKATLGVSRSFKAEGMDNVSLTYDTRVFGKGFSDLIASIFIKEGQTVYLFDRPSPMPEMSFSVANLKLSFGILVSASHNAAPFNGYKVSNKLGAQLDPVTRVNVMSYIYGEKEKGIKEVTFEDITDIISASINVPTPSEKVAAKNEFELGPLVEQFGENKSDKIVVLDGQDLDADIYGRKHIDIHSRHAEYILSHILDLDMVKEQAPNLGMIFSAMYGVGEEAFKRTAVEKLGLDPKIVREYSRPDGIFTKFTERKVGNTNNAIIPDPGNSAGQAFAWEIVLKDLVKQIMDETGVSQEEAIILTFKGIDLLGGTDPDADRLGMLYPIKEEDLPPVLKDLDELPPILSKDMTSNKQNIARVAQLICYVVPKKLRKEVGFAAIRLMTANDTWTIMTKYRIDKFAEMIKKGLIPEGLKFSIIKTHVTTDALKGLAKYAQSKGLDVLAGKDEKAGIDFEPYVGFTLVGEAIEEGWKKGIINLAGAEESGGYSFGGAPNIFYALAHLFEKYAQENATISYILDEDEIRANFNDPILQIENGTYFAYSKEEVLEMLNYLVEKGIVYKKRKRALINSFDYTLSDKYKALVNTEDYWNKIKKFIDNAPGERLGKRGHTLEKDGLLALNLVIEAAAHAKSLGLSFADYIKKELYENPYIGYFSTINIPMAFADTKGGEAEKYNVLKKSLQMARDFKNGVPVIIDGKQVKDVKIFIPKTQKYAKPDVFPVEEYEDLISLVDEPALRENPDLILSFFPEEGVRFIFDDEGKNHITERPSGTENKIRFYAQWVPKKYSIESAFEADMTSVRVIAAAQKMVKSDAAMMSKEAIDTLRGLKRGYDDGPFHLKIAHNDLFGKDADISETENIFQELINEDKLEDLGKGVYQLKDSAMAAEEISEAVQNKLLDSRHFIPKSDKVNVTPQIDGRSIDKNMKMKVFIVRDTKRDIRPEERAKQKIVDFQQQHSFNSLILDVEKTINELPGLKAVFERANKNEVGKNGKYYAELTIVKDSAMLSEKHIEEIIVKGLEATTFGHMFKDSVKVVPQIDGHSGLAMKKKVIVSGLETKIKSKHNFEALVNGVKSIVNKNTGLEVKFGKTTKNQGRFLAIGEIIAKEKAVSDKAMAVDYLATDVSDLKNLMISGGSVTFDEESEKYSIKDKDTFEHIGVSFLVNQVYSDTKNEVKEEAVKILKDTLGEEKWEKLAQVIKAYMLKQGIRTLLMGMIRSIVDKEIIEPTKTSKSSADNALVAKEEVGGINLDPALLDLKIKRDANFVPIPMTPVEIENINIEGFIPVIINVTPVTNLPLLLGFAVDTDENNKKADANDSGFGPMDRKAKFETVEVEKQS